jgi:hypothetical protein
MEQKKQELERQQTALLMEKLQKQQARELRQLQEQQEQMMQQQQPAKTEKSRKYTGRTSTCRYSLSGSDSVADGFEETVDDGDTQQTEYESGIPPVTPSSVKNPRGG